MLGRQRDGDEGAHRVADDDCVLQAPPAHRGSDVVRVLRHPERARLRLVGVAAAAQVEGEQRPARTQPLRDADEVRVRRGHARAGPRRSGRCPASDPRTS